MWIALFLLVGLAVLFGLMVVVGGRLSPQHIATCRALFATTPPAALWERLVDVSGAVAWRPDLRSVELLESDASGPIRWVEAGSQGRIAFRRRDAHAPELLVISIDDDSLPFGGSWTYSLEEQGQGTLLTLVENGEVREPVFRFLSRFVFGKHSTMKKLLEGLGAAVGDTVEIECD